MASSPPKDSSGGQDCGDHDADTPSMQGESRTSAHIVSLALINRRASSRVLVGTEGIRARWFAQDSSSGLAYSMPLIDLCYAAVKMP